MPSSSKNNDRRRNPLCRPAARTGWKRSRLAPASGVLRLRCNCSLRRLRTTLQSPRFSVTLQSSFNGRRPVRRSGARRRLRNCSAAARASPGSTSRNCPPPLEPSRTRDRPSSASRARGSTSEISVSHWERPANSSSSAAGRAHQRIPGTARCPEFCPVTGSARTSGIGNSWKGLSLPQRIANGGGSGARSTCRPPCATRHRISACRVLRFARCFPRSRSRNECRKWARRSTLIIPTAACTWCAYLKGACFFLADLARAIRARRGHRLHGHLKLRPRQDQLRRGQAHQGPRSWPSKAPTCCWSRTSWIAA